MRTRTRKATRSQGFTLPPAVRKAMLPACLAALGLAAWDDVPVPPAWRPWVAVAEQQVKARQVTPDVQSEPAALPDEDRLPARRDDAWTDAPEAAPADTRASPLALAHTHGRRVDHLSRARALRELGDPSGALTECRRALHDDPADTDALGLAARLARLTGQLEVAVLAYEQLGRLRPEEAGALVQQARLLVSLGRHAEAVHVGEEALHRDPEDAEVYQVLGRAHLGAGELPAALLRFQQAVHLDPEHGHALNNLGFALLRAGDDAKAAEVLARSAALLPHVAYVHNNLGVAYERLGRLEEARAAYASATRLSPRYVQARVNADRVNRLARADVSLPGAGAGGLQAQEPAPASAP